MRILRLALLVVFVAGVVRIGWSYVDTGQLPNPMTDIRSLVSSFDSSISGSLAHRD